MVTTENIYNRFKRIAAADYYKGCILQGNFSKEIKTRVADAVVAYRQFEITGNPVLPYISAWREQEKIIWYEFVDRRLPLFLGCDFRNLAEVFRKSVLDRRVFKYQPSGKKIKEEVVTRRELMSAGNGLREECKQKGMVDAVYKIGLPNGQISWLKDQAYIETYVQDRTCLSLGCLYDVGKEMEQKILLEKIGYFDELTKLPKRKILDQILKITIGQMQRNHIHDFVFLMMDIDHFKKVNDTYGHQAGDFVLTRIAELMLANKRKGDEIGRYGGEEFYALSYGDIHTGQQFAERLRKEIEAADISFAGRQIPVTISLGVTAAREHRQLTADGLIMKADQRLYAAKQQGRNQVVWRDP